MQQNTAAEMLEMMRTRVHCGPARDVDVVFAARQSDQAAVQARKLAEAEQIGIGDDVFVSRIRTGRTKVIVVNRRRKRRVQNTGIYENGMNVKAARDQTLIADPPE